MTGEAQAKFLELRGLKVLQAAGSFWCELRANCYLSFPHQVSLDPSPEELAKLMRRTRSLCLRYNSAQKNGLPGGLYVIRDKKFGLDSVQKRARSKVRRSLQRCEVLPVDPDLLLREGVQLNLDTMARQKRYEPEFADPKRWQRLVDAIRICPAVSVTGAFVDGRLASYGILLRENKWIQLLYQMSRTADLHHYPNYALQFRVSQHIAEPDVDAICSGPLPLSNGGGLHDFKIHMGMEVLPRTFAFQFHPLLSSAFGSETVRAAVDLARRLRPASNRVEVLANVLRGARLTRQSAAAESGLGMHSSHSIGGKLVC